MLPTLNPAIRFEAAASEPRPPLIMVSNRGPVEHWLDESGRVRQREAGGGVVTALSGIAKVNPSVWIAGADGIADETIALLEERVPIGDLSELRLVSLPSCAYQAFYESFCNPILWFVQHSLADSLRRQDLEREARDAWRTGYVPVNRRFAEAVLDELAQEGAGCQVLLHDYHLYLAPRLIRNVQPQTALQHFVHIPWPAPETWRALPNELIYQILDGLLACDSVVFQSDDCVDNFLATWPRLPGKQRVRI